jgi:glucose-fructose oxidoreductase
MLPQRARAAISRRSFLVSAAAGGAVMATGVGCAKPRSASTPPERVLGVALLGLGQYASERLGPGLKLTRHCQLRGIVTGTPNKAAEWQRKYGIEDRDVYDYQALPRIAENDRIDVVYVVTPTALHLKFAIAAAQAGKHVWCEKPMALDVEQCQAMIDACRRSGVSLSIGYRMHHEPNTQTVTDWGKSKPYGAIKSVRALVGDPSDGEDTWRMKREMGGGALYDLGVYSINAIRYATAEEPVRVLSARSWTDRPYLFREVDEHTEFELELPSGCKAYGRVSRGEQVNELRVECARGSYHLQPMQSYSGVKGEASDGTKLDKTVEHQQAKQMDDDALAILEKRPPLVPGDEGLRDIRIINAIQRTIANGTPSQI